MSDHGRGTEHTTIVERRGSGGAVLAAIVLLIAVVIGGVYLFNMQQSQSNKDQAVAGAASSVSHAADKVGDAAANASKN